MAKDFQINKLDWQLIILVLLLTFVGFVLIYSAEAGINEVNPTNDFQKQLIWFVVGLVVAITMIIVPTKFLLAFAYIIYGVSILLLVLVLFQESGQGSERWIRIGIVGLQPSEFAKVAVVIGLGRFLSQVKIENNRFKDLAIVFFIIAIPAYIVNEQPDLGTSLVFLSLIVPILYWAGLQPFTLFVILSPFLSIITSFLFISFLIWMMIVAGVLYLSQKKISVILGLFIINITVGIIAPELWNNLKPYQQQRIKILFDPQQDARGTGYQIIQSMNSIGSGGLTGKGFLKGTQTQLKFLPEQNTDFIFSVLAEEFGYVGVSAVLLLFFLLIAKMLSIASISRGHFDSLIVIGFTSIILCHVFVNTGMTVNIMPVTGLPLPFLSYGGSFLVTLYVMMGITLNIAYKRRTYF